MNKFGLLAIALAFFTVGCVPPPPPAPVPWTKVPYGMIKTEGVIIEAEKGDFVLRSRERFETPFDVPGAWVEWGNTAGMPNPGTYKWCAACRLVRVTVSGKSDKLYGVLVFSQMRSGARGPGTRSYLIQVPQRYVDEASDGRVSVVYETVSRADGKKQTAWVLWLSDMPISDCGINKKPCQ